MLKTQLQKDFDTGHFQIGASVLKQLLWYFTDVFFFRSKLIPFSTVLVFLLRAFGAKIGREVRIKPGIQIKYPWKLEIGDYSWLADCYIENLDWVKIGNHCCISQQAMLMTGNHNYKKTTFDLMISPIILEDGVWIGARATVCPGLKLHSHSILSMAGVAVSNLDAYGIYQGNPAVKIRDRIIL
ncbi:MULTISPECIES: WcaF family extracellular polysaccharide biosynthesis acetyltransferase [unclassified Pedobacter]|uniref:WcaF family extracellular polysaccharide biosynthesis acetyltransferase n=1 Tax=unclassified Pedobacter TaxID=2628915 RepID=UPI000B4B36F1|nr:MULTISPECIES: WcaF family extracellular polysaccharide biosynthesis acetyltransferase [unclassified Pedobacter]MCX2585025.1 WcaF family extracellular polysaccharide biosynthesis acetyltransferase [Pedobacter sp. MR22-3]OWK71777.1 colanic acid biosynthesis acetyltransferase WcaF [Pedobacter sp. AJM]